MGGSAATLAEGEPDGELSFQPHAHQKPNHTPNHTPNPPRSSVTVPSKLRNAYVPPSPSPSLSPTSPSVSEKSAQEQAQTRYEDGSVVVQQDGREVHLGGIGLLPEEVYDRGLHPVAAALRRLVMRNLQWESEVLAAMQVRFRLSIELRYYLYFPGEPDVREG